MRYLNERTRSFGESLGNCLSPVMLDDVGCFNSCDQERHNLRAVPHVGPPPVGDKELAIANAFEGRTSGIECATYFFMYKKVAGKVINGPTIIGAPSL